jgi:hypothetical protein
MSAVAMPFSGATGGMNVDFLMAHPPVETCLAVSGLPDICCYTAIHVLKSINLSYSGSMISFEMVT